MTSIEENKPRVERVDDIPVIYGMLERMGIRAIVDSIITPHGKWSGLSPGWVVTLWLVHILSEQNHLMEPVQQWVERHEMILTKLSGQSLRALDFSDDRLAICLRDLSDTDVWHRIESQLGLRLIRVYDLTSDVVRLDATVGTVHHDARERTLFQVGKAKNGLYATQFKLMLASLDPLGLPLAVDVEPGSRADDPLYIPSYQRAKTILGRDGLLVVGDSKMSALLTRATMEAGRDSYLTPLADQKDAPELLDQLLADWVERQAEATAIFRPEDRPDDDSEPDPKLAVACGCEVTRTQSATVDGTEVRWEERLLVIRSYSYMASMLAGLRRRLDKAEAALIALTPARGRGKKQMEEETTLRAAIDQVEKKYRVQGLFHYDIQQEVKERQVRAYNGNPARVERTVRYQLTVRRNQSAIDTAEMASGWRIYATNRAANQLSLEQAVFAYRDQIVAENVFRRLHGRMLSITPLYVQREDHAQGLIHLLTLASRVLALGDYLAREALAAAGEELAGVYAGNPKRSTARPTTERMLKAFEGIDLVIFPQGQQTAAILTALMPVHERILALLGLHPSLFTGLQSA
jgi:transposase